MNLTTLHPASSFKRGVLLPHSGRNLVILVMSILYLSLHCTVSRSQWPCGLRCDNAAAHLLGMCVRIPPGIFDWSVVQRSPTKCSVSESDREASIMRLWHTRGCCAGRGGGIPLHTIYTTNHIVQCSVSINQWIAIQMWVLKLFWVGDKTTDCMVILQKVINLKSNYRTATWRYTTPLH